MSATSASTRGIDWLGASTNGDPVTSRSGNENFNFTKLTGEIQRTQPLFAPFEGSMVNLQGLALAQWTNDIMPLPEKCYLGGSRLGRGYYAGQVTADKCWGYAVELQFDVAYEVPLQPAWGSNRFTSQFYFFRDFARGYREPADRSRPAPFLLGRWGAHGCQRGRAVGPRRRASHRAQPRRLRG